jgi:hypothetical protein
VLKLERDTAIGAQVAAMLGESVAHIGNGTGFVVGQAVNDHGSAVGAVTFVTQLNVFHTFKLTGAFFNCAVDVVGRHVNAFGTVDRHAQTRIKVDVATAHFGGYGNFLGQTREDASTFFILATFTVLDIGPFTMPSDDASPII